MPIAIAKSKSSQQFDDPESSTAKTLLKAEADDLLEDVMSEKCSKTCGHQPTIQSLFQKSSKRKKCSTNGVKEKPSTEMKRMKKDENGGLIARHGKEMDVHLQDYSSDIPSLGNSLRKIVERCPECRQVLNNDDLKLFQGDVEDSIEEFLMLCDPRLSLLSGSEEQFDSYDDRPQHKLTGFSVYDKNAHLCSFDTGLIEKNVELFFSGVVKPIYDENPGPVGGVPTRRMGPINEWWIAGFDGGQNALIGFGTGYAEYVLMQPSEDYAPFMKAVAEKIYMSKIVIEFAMSNPDARYEDLLNKVETAVPPENCSRLTEDTLLRHAQFLVEQVESYDSAALDDEDAPPLIASPCMRDLIKLAGVTLGKRRQLRGVNLKADAKKSLGPTKATTTPLVEHVFNIFFKDQIDAKAGSVKRRRCGICDVCQQQDCGACRMCKDMVKFGGSGRSKQCCINRRCPNMAFKEAEENAGADDEGDLDELPNGELTSPVKGDLSPKLARKGKVDKMLKTTLVWDCEPHLEMKGMKFYQSVKINGNKIDAGSFVKVSPSNPTDPLYLCRVRYMWEDVNGKKMFHAQWLYRASETVLGETGDPAEVYLCDDCDDNPLGSVLGKCNVKFSKTSDNWFKEGGIVDGADIGTTDDDHHEFVYQKWYDAEEGWFLDPPKEFAVEDFSRKYCPSCKRNDSKRKLNVPLPADELEADSSAAKKSFRKFLWKGDEFQIGDSVFINPLAYQFAFKSADQKKPAKRNQFDEEAYPELYRRSNDYIKGSNTLVAEPYRIGRILEIFRKNGSYGDAKDLQIRIRKFYRPENTHKGLSSTVTSDLNLLYWSAEETTVPFNQVQGKCFVLYADDVNMDMTEYTEGGPFRFYFREAYNGATQEFEDPPSEARQEYASGKGKGKGKGKRKPSFNQQSAVTTDYPTYEKSEKLKTLDIFAGCGGLSEGLHEVGVADSRWGIEFEPSAAQAFRLNNPGAVVLNEDCNKILRMVMDGRETDDSGQRLPRRGDVELLCGGPPCQGFSGMNRFNSREYSMFKNSLVASYLSYCDFFRPRFFILENVRNFVSFKKSMVLKLALRCLLKMGYQCSFGVLQAGSYGVPQTRRRAIIMAAAPGEILPSYPEPLHVFAPQALALSVAIDDKKYQAVKQVDSAPYRTITVRDAMGDLPPIPNGANALEIGYDTEAVSHFQKQMRGRQIQQVLRDHICKEMNPLVEARMRYIPCVPGSDWRDLPNIEVRLRDGNRTKKLIYTHDDKKQGRTESGELRGVCSCAEGKACDASDRQFNTLIPWCLPHTGNRHNHWAGLYGRLEWDGFFSTTVTNPEPMGKQGRVLHPEQHRVVSVRECARSQGFPDSFRFYGSILDKHRQIGNAVPPPMAAAIGREIQKALIAKKARQACSDHSVETNGLE